MRSHVGTLVNEPNGFVHQALVTLDGLVKAEIAVQELAAGSVGAEHMLLVLFAGLGLEVSGEMNFFLEFVFSVGERAVVLELA